MERRRTLGRLTALALLGLFACSLGAQTYKRISSVDAISEEGQYLIVAVTDEGSYMMRDSILSTSKKKATYVFTEETGETIQAPPATCIWQFKTTSSGLYRLYSPDCSKYLGSVNNSDTDLSLTTASNRILSFDIAYVDGLFQLLNDGTRGLRFSTPSYYLYFGLFKPSAGTYLDLCIYKLSTTQEAVLDLDQAELPTTFALYTGTSVASGTANDLTLTAAEDYWLSSGLATDAPAVALSVTEDGGLVDAEGDTLVSAGGTWEQRGDYAVLLKDSVYYTFVVDEQQNVQLVALSNVDESEQTLLSVTPFAEEAVLTTIELDDTDGLQELILTGGWSKARLTSLDVPETALAIVATAAELPDTLPLIDLSESNCLIYVAEGQALSDGQTAVVAGVTLVCGWELKDRLPFYVLQSFSTSSDATITYSRTFSDDGWQTLFLPFEPESTSSLTLQTIISVSGEKAKLDDVDAVANTPILCKLPTGSPQTIEFVAGTQIIKATTDITPNVDIDGGALCGVNREFEVTTEDNVFAFDNNGDGTTMVLLASGSTVSPFRVYLLVDDSDATRLVPTGINTVVTQNSNGEVYNLSGARATDRDRIVIKDGKKIIVN